MTDRISYRAKGLQALKPQKGEWNIFDLMWMVLFIAVISLVVSFFSEKSFGQIFSISIMVLYATLGLLQILADVSVRLFRFFFGKKSKDKDDNLS